MLINKGFTLIELLVAVAILGVLSTIGIITANNYLATAREVEAQGGLFKIAMMLEQQKLESGSSSYWNTGSSCSDKSRDIETTLFGSDDALDEDYFYFCIMALGDNGYNIIATSKQLASKTFSLNHKNEKSWD